MHGKVYTSGFTASGAIIEVNGSRANIPPVGCDFARLRVVKLIRSIRYPPHHKWPSQSSVRFGKFRMSIGVQCSQHRREYITGNEMPLSMGVMNRIRGYDRVRIGAKQRRTIKLRKYRPDCLSVAEGVSPFSSKQMFVSSASNLVQHSAYKTRMSRQSIGAPVR